MHHSSDASAELADVSNGALVDAAASAGVAASAAPASLSAVDDDAAVSVAHEPEVSVSQDAVSEDAVSVRSSSVYPAS